MLGLVSSFIWSRSIIDTNGKFNYDKVFKCAVVCVVKQAWWILNSLAENEQKHQRNKKPDHILTKRKNTTIPAETRRF